MRLPLTRIAIVAVLLGAGVLLQACLAVAAAGAVADVGVAVVKTTVAVGKAVIP